MKLFPEKLHQAFAELVAREMQQEARDRMLSRDEYILGLYRGEPDPVRFTDRDSLLALHARFRPLITSTCKRLLLDDLICELDKVYLCYRIYLHNLVAGDPGLTMSGARLSLQDALRRYWMCQGVELSPARELLLMETIDGLVMATIDSIVEENG